jgi:HEAT repeat protein
MIRRWVPQRGSSLLVVACLAAAALTGCAANSARHQSLRQPTDAVTLEQREEVAALIKFLLDADVDAPEVYGEPSASRALSRLRELGPQAVAPVVPDVLVYLRRLEYSRRVQESRRERDLPSEVDDVRLLIYDVVPQALPVLLESLRIDSGLTGWTVAKALGEREEIRAIPALAAAFRRSVLGSAGGVVAPHDGAMDALAAIGAPSVPAVITLLKDPERDVRNSAAGIAEKIGPPAAPAVPALVHNLDSEDTYERLWAAQALGAIGPGARAAVPQLNRLLKDPSSEVQAKAAHALKQIETPR